MKRLSYVEPMKFTVKSIEMIVNLQSKGQEIVVNEVGTDYSYVMDDPTDFSEFIIHPTWKKWAEESFGGTLEGMDWRNVSEVGENSEYVIFDRTSVFPDAEPIDIYLKFNLVWEEM